MMRLTFYAAEFANASSKTSGYCLLNVRKHQLFNSFLSAGFIQPIHFSNSFLNRNLLKLTFGRITFAYSIMAVILRLFENNSLPRDKVCSITALNNV